jgi:hypothetical protein
MCRRAADEPVQKGFWWRDESTWPVEIVILRRASARREDLLFIALVEMFPLRANSRSFDSGVQ